MSKVAIPRLVYQMNPYDIVLMTIMAKPETPFFREESLAYGFREVTGADPTIGFRLLLPGKANGHGPISGLELALIQMQSFHVLETTASGHLYFPQAFKPETLRGLRQRYGSRIPEKLQPFSDAVWQAAKDYPGGDGSVYMLSPGTVRGERTEI